ncbi:MAG: methylated-DNA--[protein]-cysteine S-methyltransferase [bacterium]|nr:methylated-DNA--[protein]-cysteine S-methyltransferase [bacterium]MDE0667743.1 methylated-DNA--[protein]-cysteine S-methyltransferase [bacterium]MXZ29333.1 methylated-DNA--[protein]-cysteine S-methyltransferase [Acidimicrobiia bacterium]MYB23694.1 methylated-DNA--[protein]-cysteine S-methyltransferase [Acidimicrobiia bacterium]MYJ14336.1 methylated-DNA--[protein]-cysteine S-methyltransferase [Acidimicrobiia bacterium]
MTDSGNVEANGGRPSAAGAEQVWVWDTDSPVGRLGLALTEAGLRRLTFLPPGVAGTGDVDELAADMAAAVSASVVVAAAPLDGVRRQLEEYFAGRLRGFSVAVDWRASSGFYRRALEVAAAIPYGRTRSYAGVAYAAGSPKAARAVGTAMATNPVALVVPCHRVVRADGGRGPYGGGTAAKDLLLDLEASVSGN